MDGIQTYSAAAVAPNPYQPHPQPAAPIVATVHQQGGVPPGGHAANVKQPTDYLHAIRRRIWLVLLVALPLASLGTLLVLRLPPIYSVTAVITVEPPKTDPAIRSLVGSGETIVAGGNESAETYVPSTLALLNSKSFLHRVLVDKTLGLPPSFFEADDPAAEMVGKLKVRIIPKSTNVQVTYEGRDPDLITAILNHSLAKFKDETKIRSRIASDEALRRASDTLKAYAREIDAYDNALAKLIQENSDIAPNGRNLKEAEYEVAKSQFWHMQNQVITTQQQLQMQALQPQNTGGGGIGAQRVTQLEEQLLAANRRLAYTRTRTREASDPAVTRASGEVQDIRQEIDRLKRATMPADGGSIEDAGQQLIANMVENANAAESRIKTVMEEMKESMPVYQKFTTLNADRDLKAKQIAKLRENMSAFQIIIDAQKQPVDVIDPADRPTIPIKPNRTIYLAVCLVCSFGLGLGLVCLLEHIDHSVKVPEHLTSGLALPLFGVVPRMIRNARNHRGGHLWTSGTPDSIEADAYRNLRASLLGVTDGKNPIVTLLITSAKAGEGKSTTALNLAATCARAGERTLLMDVDLRRPSLNGVFPAQDHDHGLVDVLKGDLPWQRTIVQTDLPNLDFLPTGDTRDVPIEVLGSLELRQLLLSLSTNHYDRVILDGPAVLGLADCRMLGRIVDAAAMVVRSGSQEIRSLQRAKAMLEQSQVFIAGLIFNGLCDDLANWSSYGPNPHASSLPASSAGGRGRKLTKDAALTGAPV